MLHLGSSHYRASRSRDLLQLKRYLDAETVVVAHLPGRVKCRGMLGALLVES
ncbi:MAG: DNA ligase-1, partial [Bacteroidia bacterium]